MLIWSQEWHRTNNRMYGARVGEQNRECSSGVTGAQSFVRQQRWSPLNVPLMWAATKRSDTTPVLQWLSQAGSRIVEPIEFHESHINATDAATVGWTALRAVMRSWEIHEREHLTDWLRRQGFPAVQPGNQISAHAQEFLLSEACRADNRVALLEAVYVIIAIHKGRESALPKDRNGGVDNHRMLGKIQI